MAVLLSQTLLSDEQKWVERNQRTLAQAKQLSPEIALSSLHPAALPPTHLSPEQWPQRQAVDEVVQQASQIAISQGITLRSLTVAHQSPSTATRGKVTLDVSTTGTYTALKAWQSILSQRFPALAVQSLRMQALTAPLAGLDAQWVWVLHVRD